MNWAAQLESAAKLEKEGALVAQLHAPEGALGATRNVLLFVSEEGMRRIPLERIQRVARSGGLVIVAGEAGDLLRARLSVPNDRLLPFFQDVKAIARASKLRQGAQPALPDKPRPSTQRPQPKTAPFNPASAPHQRLRHVAPGPSAHDPSASSTFWPSPELPAPVAVGSGALAGYAVDATFTPIDLPTAASLDHLRSYDETVRVEPAPFVHRALAFSLDVALFLAFQAALARLLPLSTQGTPATVLDLLVVNPARALSDLNLLAYDVGAVIAFTMALAWPYYALMESSPLQGTLGKLAARLCVTDPTGQRVDFGRATWRHFARLVAVAAGFCLWVGGSAIAGVLAGRFGSGLGLAVVGLSVIGGLTVVILSYTRSRHDPQGQTIHDMVAGCYVQRVEQAAVSSQQ